MTRNCPARSSKEKVRNCIIYHLCENWKVYMKNQDCIKKRVYFTYFVLTPGLCGSDKYFFFLFRGALGKLICSYNIYDIWILIRELIVFAPDRSGCYRWMVEAVCCCTDCCFIQATSDNSWCCSKRTDKKTRGTVYFSVVEHAMAIWCNGNACSCSVSCPSLHAVA